VTETDAAISVAPANEAGWDDLQTDLDGEPAGWCAVEPCPAYTRPVRNNRVPREGRTEDKSDVSVWAITCFFTRAGFRKRGISRALVRSGGLRPRARRPRH
jgi:GNAT superfamily N-acetyltransferase